MPAPVVALLTTLGRRSRTGWARRRGSAPATWATRTTWAIPSSADGRRAPPRRTRHMQRARPRHRLRRRRQLPGRYSSRSSAQDRDEVLHVAREVHGRVVVLLRLDAPTRHATRAVPVDEPAGPRLVHVQHHGT